MSKKANIIDAYGLPDRMKTKKIMADALRDAGEWVDGTFVYRRAAEPEVHCQSARPMPVYHGPTIDPIRRILPGEIIEWVKDKSGHFGTYPMPNQTSYGPEHPVLARLGAGLL